MKKRIFTILILAAVMTLFSATYYVDSILGNDTFAGTEVAPWKTISYGISQADSSDTLMLFGSFLLTSDAGSTTDGIEITKSLTFIGEGAKNTFVKAAATPGTATSRVFQVNIGVIVTMRNLSIENGVANTGGGISNNGVLTLENVNISSNESTNSGGGVSSSTNLHVTNSTIHSNSAVNYGGGIYCTPLLFNSNFSMENCTISGNSTTDKSSFGGGIDLSVFSSNRDVITNATINSCTIAENMSGSKAGKGINVRTYEQMFNNSIVNLNISNSIISNGTSGNYNEDTSGGGTINLDRSYTLCSDATMPNGASDGNIDSTDPLLEPLADNGGSTLTHSMSVFFSPAINKISLYAGSSDYNGAPLTDQRGVPISRGDNKDMGALEFNGGGIYYVNSETGNDSLNIGSESSPWKNLSKALSQIFDDDIIDMTGIFYMDEDPGANEFVNNGYNVAAEHNTANVTIRGQGADQTYLKACHDGEVAVSRLFYVPDGYSLTIKDISLQNGYDSNNGGAILAAGDNLTIENVMISNCSTLETGYGGAIYSTEGSIDIINSTIYDNTADENGGGIYVFIRDEDMVINITNSTFSNNSAYSGGAIYAKLSTTDDTYTWNLDVNINACTFSSNLCYFNTTGSFMAIEHDLNCNINVTLKNSIISNVYTNAGPFINFDRSYTICYDNSIDISGIGNQNNVACRLYSLSDNGGGTLTHALFDDSPAVDAIPIEAGTSDYNGAPLLDQRGVSIIDTNKDMGAYEGSIPFVYFLPAPVITFFEYETIATIKWNTVVLATGYAVYSSPDPYGTFTQDTTGTFGNKEWSKWFGGDDKYFFYMTSLDSTMTDKSIPKEIHIEKP